MLGRTMDELLKRGNELAGAAAAGQVAVHPTLMIAALLNSECLARGDPKGIEDKQITDCCTDLSAQKAYVWGPCFVLVGTMWGYRKAHCIFTVAQSHASLKG